MADNTDNIKLIVYFMLIQFLRIVDQSFTAEAA